MTKRIIIMLVVSLIMMVVGAFAGLWFGMFVGGNFFTSVTMFNMTGYELFGTLGLLVGAILGFIGGFWLQFNRYNQQR